MICLLMLIASILGQNNQSEEESDWVLIEPPGIGATIEMPAVPKFSERNLRPVRDLAEITVRSRSVLTDGGKTNLTFVYHDEHSIPTGRKKINDVLNGAVTGAITLVDGNLVKQQEIFKDSHKGRDFIYVCEVNDEKLQTTHKLKIRTQVILVGRRLFSMNYISIASDYDDDVANRYFESFKLIKAVNDLPPKPRPGRVRELAKEESAVDADQND